MKLAKTLILVLFGFIANAQYVNNWSVGLKVGEPLGLNIRKYFADGQRSFDVNFGTYGFLYGREVNYSNKLVYNQGGIMLQGIYNYQKTLGKKMP